MKTVLDEWSKETNPIAYSDFLFKQNGDLRKQIERLQEQLNEANEVIKFAEHYDPFITLSPATAYLERWCVK